MSVSIMGRILFRGLLAFAATAAGLLLLAYLPWVLAGILVGIAGYQLIRAAEIHRDSE